MLFLTEVCKNPNILRIILFVKELLKVLLFIIPIGVILMVSLDLLQSVIAKNTDEMKKKSSIAIKRVITCIIIFLIPTIVDFTVVVIEEAIGKTNWLTCYKNATQIKIKEFQILWDTTHKEEEYNPIDVDLKNPSGITPGKDGQSNSEFLSVAQRLWKKVATGNFSYTKTGTSIPVTGHVIDCSSYVSWVLYEYGYEEFKGWQHTTLNLVNTNWQEKYGWTEIIVAANEDVSEKLQPGDILVRDNGEGGKYGHVNIIDRVEEGKVYAYDCGGENNWKASSGEAIDKTSFAKNDNRSGKIIRVTKPN